MRKDRPALRERVLAAAAFGGIALGTVMAIDLLVTGGFDLGPRPSPGHYTDPFAFALADKPWVPTAAPQATVTTVAWTDPAMIDEPLPAEELAGGRDAPARSAATVEHVAAPSEDELYREIAALYAAQDARAAAAEAAYLDEPAYEDAEPLDYEDAPALDAEGVDKSDPSASETETPS